MAAVGLKIELLGAAPVQGVSILPLYAGIFVQRVALVFQSPFPALHIAAKDACPTTSSGLPAHRNKSSKDPK